MDPLLHDDNDTIELRLELIAVPVSDVDRARPPRRERGGRLRGAGV